LGSHSGASKDSDHWDETLSVGDASQRHIPEGLKPQIIPCEASCLEGTVGLLFDLI
jgi:hypothetical protein